MRLRCRQADSGAARTTRGRTHDRRHDRRHDRGPRLLLCCALAAALLAGCAPQVHMQGHVSDPDALAAIEPGVQTRADVALLLGTPSAVATFDDARWYYITRRTETTAFYDPELIEQQIVVVTFDESGVVADVSSFAAEQARAIEPVDEESPTRGSTPGMFEQFFGNLGRPAVTSDQ